MRHGVGHKELRWPETHRGNFKSKNKIHAALSSYHVMVLHIQNSIKTKENSLSAGV